MNNEFNTAELASNTPKPIVEPYVKSIAALTP